MHWVLSMNACMRHLEGVELFKKEKYDLIIVDTSGRHKRPVLPECTFAHMLKEPKWAFERGGMKLPTCVCLPNLGSLRVVQIRGLVRVTLVHSGQQGVVG